MDKKLQQTYRVFIKISPVRLWMMLAPLFIVAMFVFRSSSFWQIRILIIAAVIYLLTAVLHHRKDKTLTLEILIEYILLVILALIIAQGFLGT